MVVRLVYTYGKKHVDAGIYAGVLPIHSTPCVYWGRSVLHRQKCAFSSVLTLYKLHYMFHTHAHTRFPA